MHVMYCRVHDALIIYCNNINRINVLIRLTKTDSNSMFLASRQYNKGKIV